MMLGAWRNRIPHIILNGLKNRFKLSAFSFGVTPKREKVIKLKIPLTIGKEGSLPSMTGRIKIVKTLVLCRS